MGVCCCKDLHIPQRRNRKPSPGALALHPLVSLPLSTACAVHLPQDAANSKECCCCACHSTETAQLTLALHHMSCTALYTQSISSVPTVWL